MKLSNRITTSILLIALGLSTLFAQSGSRRIVLGLVAKSEGNPVFLAAHTGAKVAAKELGTKYGAEVAIEWRTPAKEDARAQAAAIDQLVKEKVSGIFLACSDADKVTPAINRAVDKGIPVMCFDSDAPQSKRFAYYSIDNVKFGAMMMDELAQLMDKKGTIAILGGNKAAANLQARVNGILQRLKQYPGIKLAPGGEVYHEETPDKAAAAVQKLQQANPEISGWAFAGGWPLFKKNGISWKPGEVKIVASDALPQELEYVRSGHAQELIAQNCFLWGYKSVEILLDKIVNNRQPAKEFVESPLTTVTKENISEWSAYWSRWLAKEDAGQ